MIRLAQLGDAEDLQRNCFSGSAVEEIRAMIDPYISPVRGAVIVAEATSGEIIAVCTLTPHPHRMQRHRVELTGFVIAEDHRGTGLARQMVNFASKFAVERWSTRTLELCVRGNTHAESAYRGLGFVEWGRLAGGLDDRGAEYDDVRMYRSV